MDHQQMSSLLLHQRVTSLSRKEIEVLILIAAGLNSKEISIGINVLPKSIDNYKNRIGKKLNLKGYGSLCHFARENKDSLDEFGRSFTPFVYQRAMSFSNWLKLKK